MNWDTIGAIGEIIGATAVVTTIAYLAIQIRLSRLSAADSSRTARAVGVREILQTYLNNSELRANWITSTNARPDLEKLGKLLNLDADGAFQIDMCCLSWMWLHWGQYKSMKTDDDLNELKHIVSVFYSAPPMSICWFESPHGKNDFDDDFVRFVEDSMLIKGNESVAESAA